MIGQFATFVDFPAKTFWIVGLFVSSAKKIWEKGENTLDYRFKLLILSMQVKNAVLISDIGWKNFLVKKIAQRQL